MRFPGMVYSLLVLSLATTSALAKLGNNLFRSRCKHGESNCRRHQELPTESNAVASERPVSPGICTLDQQGNFGSNKGHIVTVKYLYQLETILGVDANDLNNYVLKDVERSIINALLPDLFTEQCGTSDGRRYQQLSGVKGVTTFPRDVVSHEGEYFILYQFATILRMSTFSFCFNMVCFDMIYSILRGKLGKQWG